MCPFGYLGATSDVTIVHAENNLTLDFAIHLGVIFSAMRNKPKIVLVLFIWGIYWRQSNDTRTRTVACNVIKSIHHGGSMTRPVSDLTRNLSANLRALFSTGRLTRDALAAMTGLKLSQISEILELSADPTLEVVELISLVLDCDAGILLASDAGRVCAIFLEGLLPQGPDLLH